MKILLKLGVLIAIPALLFAQRPAGAGGSGGGGGGATIPSTTDTLKGDGAGNAAAVSGSATNCVLVNGTSQACSPISFSQGTWANKPTVCPANFYYLFLDSVYNDETCLTGASSPTYRYGGRAVTPPVLANFSLLSSSGTVTTDITHGGFALELAASSSARYEVAYPTPPFTQAVGVNCALLTNTTSATGCGLYYRDGSVCREVQMTGNAASAEGPPSFLYIHRSGATCGTFGAVDVTVTDVIPMGTKSLYLYLVDDQSTISFWWSIDGVIAQQLPGFSVSSTAQTFVGVVGGTDSTYAGYMYFLNWGSCASANTFVC